MMEFRQSVEVILARHSWAEPPRPDLADAARVLTPDGRKRAEEMGKELVEHVSGSFVILCGPSNRTRETAQAIAKALGTDSVIVHDDLHTSTTEERLVQRLMSIAAEGAVDVIIAVTHYPTVVDALARLSPAHPMLYKSFEPGSWASVGNIMSARTP